MVLHDSWQWAVTAEQAYCATTLWVKYVTCAYCLSLCECVCVLREEECGKLVKGMHVGAWPQWAGCGWKGPSSIHFQAHMWNNARLRGKPIHIIRDT